MKEFLVFVNFQRIDYRGYNTYEFIFSDTEDVEEGDNWDYSPSKGAIVTPPSVDYVTSVYNVYTKEIEFEVASHSSLSMRDSVEKIVALCYEIDDPDGIDKKRLVFSYGETKDSVLTKLHLRSDELYIKEVTL